MDTHFSPIVAVCTLPVLNQFLRFDLQKHGVKGDGIDKLTADIGHFANEFLQTT
jgi:hypothetical protein